LPAETPRKAEPQGRRKAGRVGEKTGLEEANPPPPQTATQALDRIDLSPDLVERLSALMSVGASFIISDQGLGGETGLETDFIVLTR
jgi:hypothetical protein